MRRIIIIGLALFCSIIASAQPTDLPDPEAYFTALIVKDMGRSLSWYTDVLGFRVVTSTEDAERGIKQANLIHGSALIELIELDVALVPEEVIPGYTENTRLTGLFKMGLLVPDFNIWINHLTVLNANFHGQVVADSISGKRTVVLKDPDGNRVQIFEN